MKWPGAVLRSANGASVAGLTPLGAVCRARAGLRSGSLGPRAERGVPRLFRAPFFLPNGGGGPA